MALENGEEDDGKRVNIRQRSTVLPSKKVETDECPLATFDLPYLTFYYNQKVLLYKGDNFEEMVGRLKEGLQVVLGYFYPLCGRLAQDEEGVVRVEKCGEGAGVEVIEAVADGLGMEELVQDKASPLLQKVVPFSGILNLQGFYMPLLAVQFTKLRGGLAVGCAFNHVIVDGTSTWHFLNAWAEVCRGSGAIQRLPLHERTRARDTRVKLELPRALILGEAEAAPEPPLSERIFRFSEAAVDAIKDRVNASRREGSAALSSFQSLGVHIWAAVTRARRLKPEDYTVFAIFIDCRKRVEPPLPESYFGNLIQAIFTATTAGDLLGRPPVAGAGLIQQVISSHDAGAIVGRLEEWEVAPKLFAYKDAGVNCVAVGSSPKFPVYSVDFGWGPPEKVRSGHNNKFDGVVFLYPGKDGGRSVDVEISLDPSAMTRLEQDDEFLNIAL